MWHWRMELLNYNWFVSHTIRLQNTLLSLNSPKRKHYSRMRTHLLTGRGVLARGEVLSGEGAVQGEVLSGWGMCCRGGGG